VKALIGTKLGMTQLFGQDGMVERVTLVQAGPVTVTQVKTPERDGYGAVQLGFGKAKHQAKPQQGHLKASGADSRVLREVRTVGEPEFEVGATIDVTAFEVGDQVQVTGTSKGKGFAGTIKRHNFARGPKTHGSHNYRQPGSVGSMYPEHVFKGIRMAGQMGGERVTVKNLKVVAVDAEQNVIALRGAVPGPRKGTVMIRSVS
jgi:large subunit ribosomal protein L3